MGIISKRLEAISGTLFWVAVGSMLISVGLVEYGIWGTFFVSCLGVAVVAASVSMLPIQFSRLTGDVEAIEAMFSVIVENEVRKALKPSVFDASKRKVEELAERVCGDSQHDIVGKARTKLGQDRTKPDFSKIPEIDSQTKTALAMAFRGGSGG